MRQIDHMDESEIEMLRLKGMLADRGTKSAANFALQVRTLFGLDEKPRQRSKPRKVQANIIEKARAAGALLKDSNDERAKMYAFLSMFHPTLTHKQKLKLIK